MANLSKNAFNKALLAAEQKLEPFQKKFHRKHWEQAIGSSGTLRSIDKVLQAKGWSKNGITMSGLEQPGHPYQDNATISTN